jgi:hypothetical protein
MFTRSMISSYTSDNSIESVSLSCEGTKIAIFRTGKRGIVHDVLTGAVLLELIRVLQGHFSEASSVILIGWLDTGDWQDFIRT